MKKYGIVMFFVLALVIELPARSYRVSQVPNGSVFSCRTCHTGNGGPRNSFGAQVGNGYLDGSGNVTWGSVLAGLDSDNDGATNGFELQDENGIWTTGSADPGDNSLVTNPGDASSVGVKDDNNKYIEMFNLYNNYPNPFNMSTHIKFILSKSTMINLSIFNIHGQKIKELSNKDYQLGVYVVSWNGKDNSGNNVKSGTYFAKLKTNFGSKTIKLMLVK